jgi:hypothetical protein
MCFSNIRNHLDNEKCGREKNGQLNESVAQEDVPSAYQRNKELLKQRV